MQNSFIEILKKRLLQDLVFITYKVGTDMPYEKFFLKAENENFYNSKDSNFQLMCGITNKLEVIKSSDILTFESIDDDTDEKGKIKFHEKINKYKLDYEKYSLIAKSISIDNFDDLFFREDYTPLHKQLILVFGKKIPVENLIKNLNGKMELNEEDLNFCKNIWIKAHEERRLEIVDIIDSEIKEASVLGDADLIVEMNTIKEEYGNCYGDFLKKINSFKNIKEVTEYWHPLTLPAPEIYRFGY